MGNAQAGQFDIPTTGTNEAPRREPPRCDELVKYVKTELIEWKKILQTVKKTKSEKDGEFLKERLTETAKKINDMFQMASISAGERSHNEVESDMKLRSEQNIAELHNKVADLELKIKSLQDERDDLMLRLSKVIGEKLVQDNPNISDLSDKNRPTKLGEIYSELYDNEWTDAFEGLQEAGLDEKEAVNTLWLTLQKTFEFCEDKAVQLLDSTANAANVLFLKKAEKTQGIMKRRYAIASAPKHKNISSEQSGQLQHSFEKFKLQNKWKAKATSGQGPTRQSVSEVKLPLNFEAEYKHLRKELAVTIVPAVQKAFLDIYWDDNCIPAIKPFIKKCLFLCWMMVVQEPPMCFDWSNNQGSQFDGNLYKQYTASGTAVDYVVWPTMFLHKGGPVVVKGVAQPTSSISDEKTKHT